MAAKFFGQFLLEKGLINRQQLLAALEAQHASNPVLGELAQNRGWLTPAQARRVNERQRAEDQRFGDIAESMGLLDRTQVDELLAEQKARRKLFGEILVEQGSINRLQLDAALREHGAEREDALKALQVGVSGHPLGEAATSAINTSMRLFPRTLGAPCQVAGIVDSADALDGCTVTAHVRIASDTPMAIGLACDEATMHRMACAFLSIEPAQCDDALACDALGELVNVLMGYVVRETVPADAAYRAAPPEFGVSALNFLRQGERTLAVAMASPLGPFVLIVNN
ncbi:chemotaxis protein CheX [Lysobacter sp. A3-1-A15]|uniref:chemotaxis protein CheX n=1 Tax=Novilysobacter viscosus TaxID=3098602 RepID=UPI002ED8BB72